jgi:hypothetical protein
MSETLTRPPVRRVPAVRLDIPLKSTATPEQVEWTAAFLQVLGWTSKRDGQDKLHQEMTAATAELEGNILPADQANNPYCHETLSYEAAQKGSGGLKPGPEFMAYLAALKAYEVEPIPRAAKVVETLRTTAQAYLDHYEEHPKLIQAQPQNLRKKMLCENTLAELHKYEVRDQIQALGNPPWSSETAMQAASLKATMDFESISEHAKAEVLGGDHVFPAFWINKIDDSGQKEKTFLFKPKSTQSGEGVPKGGETAREAAAGRLADLLKGTTGLDLGIPETHIVALPKSRFPESALVQVEQTDPLVGSLQQFAKTDGDLRSQSLADRNKATPEDCQKMAVLDLLTLNLDRHAGNLLVRYRNDGTPALTPIDHGLTFPDPAATERITRQLGDGFNATLGLPGAHEPFSKEMLAGIEKIDPTAIAAAMKTEVGVIDKAFPDVGNTISEASIEMSRRSAMFLKLAAPALSPAATQVAFAQNADELLDPSLDDNDFTSKARSIIFAAEGEQPGLAEFFCMTKGERSMMENVLRENGWPTNDRRWLLASPTKALALYRGDVKNPAMMQELKKKIGGELCDKLLKTYSLVDVYAKRDNPTELPPDLSGMTGEERTEQLRKLREAFPNFTILDEGKAIVAWQKFEAAGGVKAVEDAESKLNITSTEDKKKARDNLDTALERITWANSLVVLSDDERTAKLEALERAMPEETADRSKPREVSEKLKQWGLVTQYAFKDQTGKDQTGFEAVKLAADSLKQKPPSNFGGFHDLVRNVRDRQSVETVEAQQALRDLDSLWPPKGGARSIREQAIAIRNWNQFKELGGENMLVKVVKSMNLRPTDIASVEAAIAKLQLFTTTNAAMEIMDRNEDKNAQPRQEMAAGLAFVRQAARLNLPGGHPLHAKIDEVENHLKLLTGEIPPEFRKLLQSVKVSVVDGIRQVLTPKVTELEQRLSVANKAAGVVVAEDSIIGRLTVVAEEVSGAQYNENLVEKLDQVARAIKGRWEEGRQHQPTIGAWKPLVA